ncbi:hypothetical protein C8J56DRAFT_833097, partial [Mycena floridula]
MALFTRTLYGSPDSILSYLASFSRHRNNDRLLFSLSANCNEADLSRLVSKLTSFSDQTIGCISSPTYAGQVSCSLALFDRKSSVFFRSTIPGRVPTQVGRSHAFRKKDWKEQLPMDWTGRWETNARHQPPPELRPLNPKDVSAIMYLSDRSPEGISQSLAPYKTAVKLGLIAASTPFITGRPVTLFHNKEIHEAGAIGVALLHSGAISSQISFSGLNNISEIMTVDKSEGNLISVLDGENATRLLLSHIHKSGINMTSSSVFKENNEFYLASVKNGEPDEMYTITAGDPSRGTISLRTETAPRPGTPVQFFHRPKSRYSTLPTRTNSNKHSFCFSTSDEHQKDLETSSQSLPNMFLASSENGFILDRPGTDRAWNCTVPGGLAALE